MANNIIKKLKDFVHYILAWIISVTAILIINFYVMFPAIIVGDSMLPTLSSGNVVLVSRLADPYERFDVVIVEIPDEIIVKRIIGTPGDTVHIRDRRVYINEDELDDIITEHLDFSGIATVRVRLGEGEYFVLGDNRSISKDSRNPEVGVVKEEQIIGRAIVSIVPMKRIK